MTLIISIIVIVNELCILWYTIIIDDYFVIPIIDSVVEPGVRLHKLALN